MQLLHLYRKYWELEIPKMLDELVQYSGLGELISADSASVSYDSQIYLCYIFIYIFSY